MSLTKGFLSLVFFPFLQGVNRMGKDAQVGRDGVRRKDWHDYEAIKRDASRSGGLLLLLFAAASVRLERACHKYSLCPLQ